MSENIKDQDQFCSLSEKTTSDDEARLSEEIRSMRIASQNQEASLSLPEVQRTFNPKSGEQESSAKRSTQPIGDSSLASLNPPTRFETESTSTTVGAVGCHALEGNFFDPNQEYRFHSTFDEMLYSGKQEVFQRFFSEENDEVIRPENTCRYPFERCERPCRICFPESGKCNTNEDYLQSLQYVEPQEGNFSSQSVKYRTSESPSQAEFERGKSPASGYVAESERSLSAEYESKGEVNPKACSRPQSAASELEVSIGSSSPLQPNVRSIPDPPSRDLDEVSLPPIPGFEYRNVRSSPPSKDLESLFVDRSVRRRRPAPKMQSDSAPASSEGSSDEPRAKYKRKCDDSFAGFSAKTGSFIKDTDQKQLTDSEDEAKKYPELSHSVESDNYFPMTDIEQEALEELQASSEGDIIGDSKTSNPDNSQPMSESQTESEGVEDLKTVLSCSPENSKDSEQPAPKSDMN